jgi:hypothetical protein
MSMRLRCGKSDSVDPRIPTVDPDRLGRLASINRAWSRGATVDRRVHLDVVVCHLERTACCGIGVVLSEIDHDLIRDAIAASAGFENASLHEEPGLGGVWNCAEDRPLNEAAVRILGQDHRSRGAANRPAIEFDNSSFGISDDLCLDRDVVANNADTSCRQDNAGQ